MAYEDYSQEEIDSVLEDLLTIHKGKLSLSEQSYLKQLKAKDSITNQSRDYIIAMYDRLHDGDS